MLLRNNGTAEQPSFKFITDDYLGLSEFGFDGIYPTFGDMDNDGDNDMLLGDEEGRMHLFRNDGGAGNPADFTISQPNYMDIDAGMSAKPQIVDVNNDNLPDLLVGERSGTIKYYENIGTPENSLFASEATVETFGGIDVMKNCCTGYSSPFLTTDSLDNKILYIGSEQGKLYAYNHIENNLYGSFNLVDSLYLHIINASVTGTDLNMDGTTEFAFGSFAGGVRLLKSGNPPGLGIRSKQRATEIVTIYPNPATNFIKVLTRKTLSNHTNISIINRYGQRVKHINPPSFNDNFIINIEGLQPGIYLLRITDNQSRGAGQLFVKAAP